MAKTLGPRSLPRLLQEESDLDRLDEDPVRVVSETLQLDAAGACLFSYLLKTEPDGYSDGLCRPCAPHAPGPSHHLSGPPSSASLPLPYPYRVIGMVIAFVGLATFDKPRTGATSILQALIFGKPEAPVEQRHTGSLLLLLRFLRSCAWCGSTCTRLSDCGVMTYRIPGTQVALFIEVGRG